MKCIEFHFNHTLNLTVIVKMNYKKDSESTRFHVSHIGEVFYYEKVRALIMCDMQLGLYPFDSQECSIDIAAPGFKTEELKFSASRWIKRNGYKGDVSNMTGLDYGDTQEDVLYNAFYQENEEWQFKAYKVTTLHLFAKLFS